MNPGRILQFKITLNDSSPKIWRRIQVHADYTFFDLHVAIQDAMGWTDSHLHGFYFNPHASKERITIEYPNPERDDLLGEAVLDERKEKIGDYFGNQVKQCIYAYDFGDDWDHTVVFEGELPAKPKTKYPRCVAGENACPQEDCGGVGGYEDLQKIMRSPKRKDYKEMMEWLCIEDPEEFNPAAFNPEDVDFEDPLRRLKEYQQEHETG